MKFAIELDSQFSNFGEALRALRESRGMSQRHLAAAVGVDHTYISHLESGRRVPSLLLMTRLLNEVATTVTIIATRES